MWMGYTEEMILNEDSPLYGKFRCFRIEYGGFNEDCLAEGRIYVPIDKENLYLFMDRLMKELGRSDEEA